jgi:hypothetical protein
VSDNDNNGLEELGKEKPTNANKNKYGEKKISKSNII